MNERIAFIIPAHNESGAIASVVRDINVRFPHAAVYVCDNASSDDTALQASGAGAIVLIEPRKGKGQAVRRLFRDVEADVYVLIDGDNTYDMSHLQEALREFSERAYDLMTGNRFAGGYASSMRLGHGIGNRLFTMMLRNLFGIKTHDLFSGLRILSRRFVKSFPMISSEFEVETEITTYAAKMQVPSRDFPTGVQERQGTLSKLNTFRDGFKILWFALRLLHREYPLKLYSFLSGGIFLISSFGIVSVFIEYLETSRVDRLPTLVLSVSGITTAIVLLIAGLILKEIVNLKYESRMLSYLASGSSR